jgi:hypothetical protein
VLWTVAFFVAGQLALLAALERWPGLRDPEYGRRLACARDRRAEAEPGRPLVVLLGSSHVGLGVRPDVMTDGGPGPRRRPVVVNCAVNAAAAMMELVTLRRLLADGVRPDLVLLEVCPLMLTDVPGGPNLYGGIGFDRLGWRDLALYDGLVGPEPVPVHRRWLRAQLLPWASHRFVLMNLLAPQWEPPRARVNLAWDYIDAWGWQTHPSLLVHLPGPCRQAVESCRRWLAERPALFHITPVAERALREALATCAREGTPVALLYMPESSGLRRCYPPEALDRFAELLRQVGREHNAPLIDGRDWSEDADFADCHHLTPAGAARFSRRLFHEAILPLLQGPSPSSPAPGPGPH